jgi:thiol-disulfide isomerase/thioredoxin
MNRRSSLITLTALLGRWPAALAAQLLTPLDENAFRRMVAGHHGRILLVDFWATWCAPCREEMPKLVSLAKAQKNRGLDLVTISCDEPEQEAAAAEFLDKHVAPAPRYLRHAKSDDDFINAIDTKWSGALPALFLFDRNGKQAQSFIGETDMKLLQDAVERALTAT